MCTAKSSPRVRETVLRRRRPSVRIGAGVHTYWKPEDELPLGVAPVAAKINNDAIVGGYFLP